jgi:hypothetical protein
MLFMAAMIGIALLLPTSIGQSITTYGADQQDRDDGFGYRFHVTLFLL